MNHIILFCLWLFSSLTYATGPNLSEILTHDISSSQQLVVFQKTNQGLSSLSRVRMHFLSANDCYSGYIGFYDNKDDSVAFSVRQHDYFGLQAAAVYAAAIQVVGDESRLEKNIHSVLIRLITDKKRFAYFTGSCNDQDVNCCIAIECSRVSGVCLPRNAIDIQATEMETMTEAEKNMAVR